MVENQNTVMMLSNMYSHENNKCAQVFALNFGWVHVYPMKTKGEAFKVLSLMFCCEGTPPSMVMDGSKEQTLGKFCHKLVDVYCQLKNQRNNILGRMPPRERDQRSEERLGV